MTRRFLGSILLAVFAASTAQPQAKPQQAGAATPISWADLVGDWEGRSMVGQRDSVITTTVVTFTMDKAVWMRLPNRESIAGRIVAVAGDSVIADFGPYPSVTRPGRLTTVRSIMHFGSHKSWGTFHSVFEDGSTLTGRTEAVHRMKP